GAAQAPRLLDAKGRPDSSCWHLVPSNSLSMVSWPTFDRRRAISSSRSSDGRLFMAAVPPSRKASRQPESVAAVTPSSRETVSRSSPLRRRRTASDFRLAENRPRSWLSVLVLILGISGTPSGTIMVQMGVQRKPQAKELRDGEETERSRRQRLLVQRSGG